MPTRLLPRDAVLGLLLALALALALGLSPALGVLPGARADEQIPVGQWPLRPVPEVVADFDPPDSPYGSGHRGVDLAGSPGQVVRTALPGRVSFAAPLAGRGVVVVSHGSTRTTYEPVEAEVSVGTQVAAGDPIGRLQRPGSHCFPRACLHWGWIRGETYLDPLLLVGLGPMRLLPLTGAPLPRASSGSGPGAIGWHPPLLVTDRVEQPTWAR